MLKVDEVKHVTGIRFGVIVAKDLAIDFGRRLHETKGPLHCLAKHEDIFAARVLRGASDNPHEYGASTDAEMERRLEISYLGHNLEEQSELFLDAKYSQDCSCRIVYVTHRGETPSAYNGEAAIIGNYFVE